MQKIMKLQTQQQQMMERQQQQIAKLLASLNALQK
jgi:sulfur carrier protein ThiS